MQSSVVVFLHDSLHLCFLNNRANIILTIHNTSYHGAIKKMFSKRNHFAEDSKSYYWNLKMVFHFCLYVKRIAVCLIQYHIYAICLRFGQISNVPLCSQSLRCFRVRTPALKTPKVLLLCNFAATVKPIMPSPVHLLLSLSPFSRCLNVKPKWKATAVWKLYYDYQSVIFQQRDADFVDKNY